MENIKSIKVPEEVGFILRVLNSAGFEAFVVGGCVRDSIMGREPGDWDITTSAKPHEMKFLFKKTIDTGIKHGTVTVVVNKMNFEVTTYRIEGEYTDNRRPERVEFTSSLKEDLARRDFTINAIAYHPEEGYIDPYHGLEDIKASVIRAVGNPDDRFKEDALRMLRAIRFSAQLGFEIEPDTYKAICSNAALIMNISSERIRDELTKTLISNNPEKFGLLHDTGIMKLILPEFEACYETEQNNPYHIYSVAEHTLKSVASIKKDTALRWTMLLHDTGKPLTKTVDEEGVDHFYGHQEKSMKIAEDVLHRLRFDNKTIETVARLIKHHDRQIEPRERAVRKALNIIGEDLFEEYLLVREADVSAQSPQKLESSLHHLNAVKNIYEEIREKGQCTSLRDLAINGDVLIELGIKPGKEMKTILEMLLEAVIDNPELNHRQTLEKMIRENQIQK